MRSQKDLVNLAFKPLHLMGKPTEAGSGGPARAGAGGGVEGGRAVSTSLPSSGAYWLPELPEVPEGVFCWGGGGVC